MPHDDPISCPGNSLKYNRKILAVKNELHRFLWGKTWKNTYQERKKKIGCDFPLKELESQFTPQGAEAVWPPWPLPETWLCRWCWLGLCFLGVLNFTCYPCLLERQFSKCSSVVMIQHAWKVFRNFTQYLEKIYFLGKTKHTSKVIYMALILNKIDWWVLILLTT